MQEAQKQGGKIETIKNLKAVLPSVEALRVLMRDARSQLESLSVFLRTLRNNIVTQREEAIKHKQKQQQFAELKKQREAERLEAEQIIDRKAETLIEKKEIAAAKQATPIPQPQKVQQTPRQYEPRQYEPRQYEPRTAFQSSQRNSEYPSSRTQTNTSTPRTFTSNNQGGHARPPFAQRPGGPARPGQPNRTWTPNQSTYQRPAQGTRPGGYPPRTPGAPGSRPMGPRTAGSTGLGAIKPTERFTPKVNTFDNNKKKTKSHGSEEKSGIDKRSLLRRGIIEEHEIEERMLTRIFKTKKAKENSTKSVKTASNVVVINSNTLTVKTFSEKIGKTAAEIIKQLMVLGNMCTINSTIDFATAELVALEFGISLELHAEKTGEEKMKESHKTKNKEEGESRPAVVTVMGHVDHGKTSLLDAIRKTNVVSRESGGITQHIGAYQVVCKNKKITFIDTPGHAAFEKMRARGAKITDIAILIVAADDGVMPQTVEAIKHIQKQEIPMVVAINKMDKKEANPQRILEQLTEHNVVAEEWGGNAIVVPISATTGQGIDKLLEMILLVADMNAYKANPNKEAQGTIIDSRLDKTRGPVVTVLVRSGTLKIGDTLLAGTTYGKVRGMIDENGRELKKALPSTPVSVLGFNEVPNAGDSVYVVDEKLTKQVVSERKAKAMVSKTEASRMITGSEALAKIQEDSKKQLNIIIKGDVAGSVEAIIQSINNITSDEVNINVISSGVGAVNDNDVQLAEMANALLIAFHAKVIPSAKDMAKKAKIQIHEYKIIYEIFDFITEQMVRMFSAKFVEKYLGRAEVRALFKSSSIGLIAGCMVTDGKIVRGTQIKQLRGSEILGTFKIESLKIKIDDQKEVAKGFECGIKLEGVSDIKAGDTFECIGQEQLPIIFNGKKYEF